VDVISDVNSLIEAKTLSLGIAKTAYFISAVVTVCAKIKMKLKTLTEFAVLA
jgi:hypothetical protein